VIQRESLEHIAKGIKMSPEREKSFLFLGRIFKAIGQTKNARGMFRRALKIRPEFHPAKQELRLLNMRERKKQKKGFLDRLAKK
jgi:Tfp pilus assembly protein PilF